MLSYMLPMDEKPPINKEHLQLKLEIQQQQQEAQLASSQSDHNTSNHRIVINGAAKNGQSVRPVNGNSDEAHNEVGESTFATRITTASASTGPSANSSFITSGINNGGNNVVVVHQTMKKTVVTNSGASGASSAIAKMQCTTGNISKDSSVSSFLSDVTSASSMTPTSTVSDKPKTKILTNGGTKHTTLKRVSFGSSKGSMVETLIYESPLQEEPENSPIVERPCPNFPADASSILSTTPTNSTIDQLTDAVEVERSKVRVSFFQQSTPQQISSPLASLDNLDLIDPITMTSVASHPPSGALSATATITDINGHLQYNRQESTDSGWENPFRPGGELSREAEEIVELIKGGKPITPTPSSTTPALPGGDQVDTTLNTSPLLQKQSANNVAASPKSPGGTATNGNANAKNKQPGAVDVKRDTINAAGEAELVVLKKKPKCKCCVIQ